MQGMSLYGSLQIPADRIKRQNQDTHHFFSRESGGCPRSFVVAAPRREWSGNAFDIIVGATAGRE